MFKTLKSLFVKDKTDYLKLINQGAIILDVRNKEEFKKQHIKGSINIPLNNLQNNLHMLTEKSRAVITCCDTGLKSISAKSLLKINGYSNVYNGGVWQTLHNKLK